MKDLRKTELNFGEFLGSSLKLYFKNFIWIGLLTILCSVTVEFLSGVALLRMLNITMQPTNSLFTILLTGGTFFVQAVFNSLLIMSITLVIWKGVNGEKAKVGSILQLFATRIFSSLWISLIVLVYIFPWLLIPVLLGLANAPWLLTFIGFFPTIYWGIKYVFAQQALVIEDERGVGALRYSKDLVQGHWWKVFGYFFGAGLLVGVLSSLILAIYDSIIFNPTTMYQLYARAAVGDLINSFTWVSIAVLFINMNFVYNKRQSKVLHSPKQPSTTL